MKPPSDKKTDPKIQDLAQYLYNSQYPVFFTGAGISTESGLPDFRGPDGVWTRRDKGLPPRSSAVIHTATQRPNPFGMARGTMSSPLSVSALVLSGAGAVQVTASELAPWQSTQSGSPA